MRRERRAAFDAAFDRITTAPGGIVAIGPFGLNRLRRPAAAAQAGDRLAATTLVLLTDLLDDFKAVRKRGRLFCFCCGEPIDTFPTVVLLTADTPATRGVIGGAIGLCCDRPEPELYVRVIAALNANVAGGAFQPWQYHQPGHA